MIELHTYNTPNGRKISVALEEMGVPYAVKVVDITKDQQFAPDFLRISPNNRIPAIIDPDGPGGRPCQPVRRGPFDAGHLTRACQQPKPGLQTTCD